MYEDSPPPVKRIRKGKRTSCERCRRRKQACDGLFPSCSNCYRSGAVCIHPDRSVLPAENIQSLPRSLNTHSESVPRFAKTPSTVESPSYKSPSVSTKPRRHRSGCSTPSINNEKKHERQIADAVGFLCLGGEQSYVGSSSGYALAVDLGSIIQATVWNKIRPSSSTADESGPKTITPEDLVRNGSGPPNDEMGERILQAYLTRWVTRTLNEVFVERIC